MTAGFPAFITGSAGLGVLASYTGYHFIYGFSVIFLFGLLLAYTLIFVVKKQPKEHYIEASNEFELKKHVGIFSTVFLAFHMEPSFQIILIS